ncbi:MAG TPA: ABC transporter permease [Streptosporangiaceae bacterium]|nr:ABC transporter permease [Streptosporangiaceae bacterium]
MTAVAHAAPAALPRRVSPIEGLRHTLTLTWRVLVQIKHNPMELMDFSVQPIMFVLLFTYVFGGQMAGSPEAYVQYMLAGIMVQNALFATLNTGMGLNLDITKGVFDRLRSLPISQAAPLASRILSDSAKQAWSMVLILSIGVLIGFRPDSVFGVVEAFALVLVFTLAFAWVAVLIGLVVNEPEKVMIFGFTTVFPLSFTSTAFVRIETLPGWLQAWAKVNPVSNLADATRGMLVGGPIAGPAVKSLIWAVVIIAVAAPLAVRVLRGRV